MINSLRIIGIKFIDKMACEFCGKNQESCIALIENAKLNVCEECSRFGKILSVKSKTLIPNRSHVKNKESDIEILIEDYAAKIKHEREKLRLSQKDFSMKLNEKVSTIQKIENNNLRPSAHLIKKIEMFLGIKLVSSSEENGNIHQGCEEKPFTIGDFIKEKRKEDYSPYNGN